MKPVFFDAACQVGKNIFGKGVTAAELLQEMDRCGVAKALVRDFNLAAVGAAASNQQLVEMLKADDPDHRLTAVWGLLPEACEELLPPAEFFQRDGGKQRSRAAKITDDDRRNIFYRNAEKLLGIQKSEA